ncbi:MAG: hypothetical protein NTV82_02905, partial [Candidatus Aminicenantes bacterium]|nr:hypothetical protein [Candidatus Aminicenantes bacterium]
MAVQSGNRSEVEKIFPETRRWGMSFNSLEADREWRYFPRRRAGLIRRGKAKKIVFFFDKDIPWLVKNIVEPIYSDEADIEKIKESFGRLNDKLKKIRQYFIVSHRNEEDIKGANNKIAQALQVFNGSILREIPSLNPLPNFTIEKIDEFIFFHSNWAEKTRIITSPVFGRPPKTFSIIIFHVVNRFSERAFDKNGEPIMKDGEHKIRRNWRLICAALLWLHVQYGIPEIKSFIENHKKEEAIAALGN